MTHDRPKCQWANNGSCRSPSNDFCATSHFPMYQSPLFELDVYRIAKNYVCFKGTSWVPMGEYPRYIPKTARVPLGGYPKFPCDCFHEVPLIFPVSTRRFRIGLGGRALGGAWAQRSKAAKGAGATEEHKGENSTGSAVYNLGELKTISAEVTPKGGLVRESCQSPLNSGLGIIQICPDIIWICNIYIAKYYDLL